MFDVSKQDISAVFDHSLRAVIFDMDGVIVDSERLHLQANVEVLARNGIDLTPDEVINLTFGKRALDHFRDIVEIYGTGSEDIESWVVWKTNRYFELAETKLDLISGFREFFDVCRSLEYEIALVTSGTSDVQYPVLDRFGLRDIFDVSVMGDEVKRAKPDPEPYLLATSRLEIDPSHCIVFEDSDSGIRSAKAAGCRVAGIANTMSRERLLEAGADLVIDGFAELMNE